MGLSMQEKKALTREVIKRYQRAGKKEKTEILNELVKTTGYNRKYVLHVLANWGKTVAIRIDEELLLTVSPSTIDRLLKQEKKKLALKGKRGDKAGQAP
jgi:hydrogenase maturation factor